jgi:hypothetical protein
MPPPMSVLAGEGNEALVLTEFMRDRLAIIAAAAAGGRAWPSMPVRLECPPLTPCAPPSDAPESECVCSPLQSPLCEPCRACLAPGALRGYGCAGFLQTLKARGVWDVSEQLQCEQRRNIRGISN